MSTMEELRLDAEEVQRLLETATRKRVKDCLTIELKKIETKITQLTATLSQNSDVPAEGKPVKTTITQTQRVLPIKTYAWDQSNKFMKIYVTLQGVQDTAKEQITCQFGERSFNLQCQGVKGKNYECVVNTLLEEIVPEESYHKVKTDSVLVMLKKKKESTWAYVTQQEKKLKDKPKDKDDLSDGKDPNETLMNMMKKMYDEGDDDMKRTIAKAWSESNDKKKAGGDIL